MKFEDIEKKIVKENEPIRLERTLKKRTESLEEFIVKFFQKFNEDRNTIYVMSKKVQTDTGRRRSMGDIYMICKYYYPTCTLKEVAAILYRLIGTERGFRSSICSQIHKRVFYFSDSDANQLYGKTTPDEYGKTTAFWNPLELNLDDNQDEDDM